ncbi:hypothetical protein SGFS_054310 [Streptomyces graminofaciens]|uniref:Uncharacterized protein n=1 Tax=Streptomyces graminofaciens TaxID=68212 RepID=A0ABN5VL25_9ACTN|nr:hypothetical protein SGFS_054310 [Streptomyces graminofaciens]
MSAPRPTAMIDCTPIGIYRQRLSSPELRFEVELGPVVRAGEAVTGCLRQLGMSEGY